MFFIIVSSGLFFIFKPDKLKEIQNSIKKFSDMFNIENLFVISISFIGISILITLISYVIWILLINFKVAKVNLLEKAEMQKKTTTDSSVFNKNLDEILYFFETNNYNIVFIEDLDRFENAEIFVKLRELNTLINNYEMIKNRMIFIYAVKDDMFTKSDRTKFFDFIIPVIPIINSSNSGEKILKKVKIDKISESISEGFINKISVYIDDMRILNNIFNEFNVFKNITEDIKGLDDEKMFALMTFKNLYPKEFADLQYEKGIVYEAFKNKKTFIKPEIEKLNEEINNRKNILERIDLDYVKSLKELKQILLCDLMGKMYEVSYIEYYENGSNKSIKYEEFIKETFNIEELYDKGLTIRYGYYGYYNEGTIESSIKKVNDKPENYIKYEDRFEYLKYSSEDKKLKLKDEINKFKKEQHDIKAYKLKDLLEIKDIDKVLSKDILKNKFLVFALRNGYIDEYYSNYLNYFHPNSITKSDMDFIMSVRNYEALDYEYELSKENQILVRLECTEFEQKEIYNNDLLEYLLGGSEFIDSKKDEKLDLFIKQLSDDTEKSKDFIDQFIEFTKHKDKFFRLICKEWRYIWKFVYENKSFNNERKLKYIFNIFNFSDIEDIIEISNKSNLKEYVLCNSNILLDLYDIDKNKIKEIIKALDIKFITLNCKGVDSEVLDYIFENMYYEINVEMLENIFKVKCENLIDDFKKRNYTSILKSNLEKLMENININFDVYVQEVFLKIESNNNETPENVFFIINRLIDNIDLCKKIIHKENCCLEDISYILKDENKEKFKNVKEILDFIIEESKLIANWENILLYYKEFSITDSLRIFIEEHIDKIIISEELEELEDIKNNFMKDVLLSNDFDLRVFNKLSENIKINIEEIDFCNMDEKYLESLININYFTLKKNIYDKLRDKFKLLSPKYIIKNKEEYLDNLNEYPLEKDGVIYILKCKEFTEKEKIKVIKCYGTEKIDQDIAYIIYEFSIELEKEVVEVLWDRIDKNYRKYLLYKNINLYSNKELYYKFGELEKYKVLQNVGKGSTIDRDDFNEKLVKALKEKTYITSSSPVLDKEKIRIRISRKILD